MARTLSDTLIIAMIESATRLAGGRGPAGAPSGGAASQGGTAATPPPAGEGAESGAPVSTVPPAGETTAPDAKGSGAPAGGASGEHDTRTAEQIPADFKTIYTQIEEVVRSSAEQETKTVGFGQR